MRGLPILSCLVLIGSSACGSDESGSPGGGSGAAGRAGTAGRDAGQSGGAAGGGNTTGMGGGSGSAGMGGSAGSGGSGGSNVVTPNQSCTSPAPAFTSQEKMLVDLPADSWFAAPNTKIRPLCPTTTGNCANVIGAWSGGAFDPVHNQMLIFGGGHGDYSGNEVYAFQLSSLSWVRLTDPSPDSYKSQDPLPDGKPVSRHSYDGLSYVTP